MAKVIKGASSTELCCAIDAIFDLLVRAGVATPEQVDAAFEARYRLMLENRRRRELGLSFRAQEKGWDTEAEPLLTEEQLNGMGALKGLAEGFKR